MAVATSVWSWGDCVPEMKWLIVLGVAVLIVLIGSVGRIPFSERQLATSEETRAAAKADQAPRYTRAQAISMVEKHIREKCSSADKYLPHVRQMEATFIRETWTNDFYERGDREWTISDPLTGALWRMYEDTNAIITVFGDC